MKEKVLNMLKENKKGFISGQKLSEILGVSRTAVWKVINHLRDEGYDIESVSRKGYRLKVSPDILTQGELNRLLNTNIIGNKIIHFDSIDSTNTYAKELASRQEKAGTVIIAEEQTAGKGRLGRNWTSPKGKGIWMSLILKPDIDPTDAAKITQIGAAAVCEAIRDMGIEAYVKWPNDIILNNKKVCGILTEMSGELNTINYIVMGIGINANIDSTEFPDDIRKIATSLKEYHREEIDRKHLVASILNRFEDLYKELIDENSIKRSIKICKDSSILLGKQVRIISRHKEELGKAIDITENGELIIEKENGEVEKVISGEISVRGINGYV
ncbi:biotin--[acetyl-CoA-carboxylase] ligase [Sporosalibacterium faouarense]|uniref:biotin--[acetyl-CoA-carboxylase] ligase n=1 Tax=Sporosalibacterium faouarense TaxID=516123 RepID=UPI00141CE333|nr:biotin--[acetyl-CoA-carboxylase] ligase [Sporosalibacterium faouarense]MTI46510.1 biotin--[acetyl-CoA-carboxylase] ligase [Bacillota bacterium]